MADGRKNRGPFPEGYRAKEGSLGVEEIKTLLLRSGMCAAHLAKAIGITPQRFNRYVNGWNRCPPFVAERLIKYVEGLDPDFSI